MKAKITVELIIFSSVFIELANTLVYGLARKVVDGDTLYIDKIKIRLYGIDAPEINQQCKNLDSKNWDCG